MLKRSGGGKASPVLPTTTTSNGGGGDHSANSNGTPHAPPTKNPKRHRRPNLGSPLLYGGNDMSPANDYRAQSTSCSNFLLGGQYYPGKDKSRRSHASNKFLLRRRSLAYRIFCSSPPRMCGTAILASYAVFVLLVAPMFGLLMDLGRSLAGGGPRGNVRGTIAKQSSSTSVASPADLDGRNYPSLEGMNLRPMEETKKEAMRLYEEKKKHRDKFDAVVMETLEDLVPDWLHRNDPVRIRDNQGGGEGGDAADFGQEDANQVLQPMEDDEEYEAAKAARDADVRRGDNANALRDVDANPEEGIDLIRADDDIDNARGDDGVDAEDDEVDNGEKRGDAAAAMPGKNIPPVAKTQTHAEKSQVRSLQNMDDLPPSSSCPAHLSPGDISTALVIQCSLDRVGLLIETCNRWEGSIVLTLFLANEDEEAEWSEKQSDWEEMCPQMTILPHLASEAERKDSAYPVNMLRNIGLDAVKTSHVMMMDADFVPSKDLYDTINDVLKARHQMSTMDGGDNDDRDALIVPAFERKPPKPCENIDECRQYIKDDSNFIPQNIEGLRNCSKSDKKDCIVFQSDNNWEGHHTTHSEQWLKGDWYEDGNYRELIFKGKEAATIKKRRQEKIDLSRDIKSVKCFDSLRYEPWVVVRWCPSSSSKNGVEKGNDNNKIRPVAPYFDERFHGYGKNKIQMTSHLRFLGYKFFILPLSFIIHQPHPISKAKHVWQDGEKDLHWDMDKLYPQFLRELTSKYDGGKNATPSCKKNNFKTNKKPREKGSKGKVEKLKERAGIDDGNKNQDRQYRNKAKKITANQHRSPLSPPKLDKNEEDNR